jgi:hypothetical protein
MQAWGSIILDAPFVDEPLSSLTRAEVDAWASSERVPFLWKGAWVRHIFGSLEGNPSRFQGIAGERFYGSFITTFRGLYGRASSSARSVQQQ